MDLNKKYSAVAFTGDEAELSLGEIFSFSDKTILYFYPKDNTPGCSKQAVDFSSLKEDFKKLGIQVIGVSKDSLESHQKFISKKELKIDLISDPELELHNELGAYGEKKNYGKTYMGTIRSTFLFDKEGNILEEYRNVRATGHAERMLKELNK